MTRALLVAGLSGTGKTTLARDLERRCSYRRVAFGDTVRREARLRGLEGGSLVALGDQLIREWGWDRFCGETLGTSSGTPLVVDGVRHRACVQTLQKLPRTRDSVLIYLYCDEELRLQRIAARGGNVLVETLEHRGETESLRDWGLAIDTTLARASDRVIEALGLPLCVA